MIERKDGETDASWIGRLEAAYKALIPACEKLQEKLAESDKGWSMVYDDLKVEADATNEQLRVHTNRMMAALGLLAAIRSDPNLGGAWKQRIDSLLTPPPPTG